MDTKGWQLEIRRLIESSDLSQKDAATWIHHELDSDDDIDLYFEKFKKRLQRKTTEVPLLETFYKTLLLHPKIRKVDQVVPILVKPNTLSKEFHMGMQIISQHLGNKLSEEEFEE